MDDETLKRAFAALREEDRAEAPSFAALRSAAQRRARQRRVRNLALASGLAAAAAILVVFWITQPGSAPPARALLARPPETLGFLLEPPVASVMGADTPIAQIGEAW